MLCNTENYWFNTWPKRIDDLRKQFRDDFCLVLYKDKGNNNDAYIIPYKVLSHIFIDSNLRVWRKDSLRLRWLGTINNGNLKVEQDYLDIANYHNAFDLLDIPLISTKSISIPEEILEHEMYFEGAKKSIYINAYERSIPAREKCIAHFGVSCNICGFDFEKVYGEEGKGLIHIHHLTPLSNIQESYTINPLEDLRPVCPNCHAIIHRRTPPFTIDEVKAFIKNKSRNQANSQTI